MAASMIVYTDTDPSRNSIGHIEWQEPPSLSKVVLCREAPGGAYALAAELVAEARTRLRSEPSMSPLWMQTRPSELDPWLSSGPLRETELGGLDAREIVEPDVFRHFFGTAQR
jgi:hypothetical protein